MSCDEPAGPSLGVDLEPVVVGSYGSVAPLVRLRVLQSTPAQGRVELCELGVDLDGTLSTRRLDELDGEIAARCRSFDGTSATFEVWFITRRGRDTTDSHGADHE